MPKNEKKIIVLRPVRIGPDANDIDLEEVSADFMPKQQAAIERLKSAIKEVEASSGTAFADEIFLLEFPDPPDPVLVEYVAKYSPSMSLTKNAEIVTTPHFLATHDVGQLIAVLRHEMHGHYRHGDHEFDEKLELLKNVIKAYQALSSAYSESPRTVAARIQKFFGNSQKAKSFFRKAYRILNEAIATVSKGPIYGRNDEWIADFMSAYPEEIERFSLDVLAFPASIDKRLESTLNQLTSGSKARLVMPFSGYSRMFSEYVNPIAKQFQPISDFITNYQKACEFRGDEIAAAGGADTDASRTLLAQRNRRDIPDPLLVGRMSERYVSGHPDDAGRLKRLRRLERMNPFDTRGIGYKPQR